MFHTRCVVKYCLKRRLLCTSAAGYSAPLPTLYPKKLGDILNIDKLTTEFPLYNEPDAATGAVTLNDKSIETIQKIWIAANSEAAVDPSKSVHSMTAVLPDYVRQDWLLRASQCPFSLVPVFHEPSLEQIKAQVEAQGEEAKVPVMNYRMMVSQFQKDSSCFILTHLEEYQRNPATASPWCTISLYSMLEGSSGEVDAAGSGGSGGGSGGGDTATATPGPSTSLLRMEYISYLLTQQQAQFVLTQTLPLLYSDPGTGEGKNDYTGSVRLGHVDLGIVGSSSNMRPASGTINSIGTPSPNAGAGLFNQLSFLNLLPKHFSLDTYVQSVHGVYTRETAAAEAAKQAVEADAEASAVPTATGGGGI